MPQHVELSPAGHLQKALQIVLHLGIAGLLVRLPQPAKVLHPKAGGEHMDRADDKIVVRPSFQQTLRPRNVHRRVPQLQTQPELYRPVPLGNGVLELRRLARPVKAGAQGGGAQFHWLEMVREADLVQPCRRGGAGHVQHGDAPVGGEAGMGMIISQIHGVPHFLNFLKKRLRSS